MTVVYIMCAYRGPFVTVQGALIITLIYYPQDMLWAELVSNIVHLLQYDVDFKETSNVTKYNDMFLL